MLEESSKFNIMNSIENIIESEIKSRTKSYEQELHKTQEKLQLARSELKKLKNEYKQNIETQEKLDIIKFLADSFDENNMEHFINCFDLKPVCKNEHFREKHISKPLKYIILYNNDKETIIKILKLLNIEYPDWMKYVKTPNNYNEEELEYVLKNIDKISIPNACYYSDNLGFFINSVQSHNGDLKKMLNGVFSSSIPWQLLLKNPLLQEDKYFNIILDKIENYTRNCHHFFKISSYQNLSNEKIEQMMQLILKTKGLRNKIASDQEIGDFISNNIDVLKKYPNIAWEFKDYMSINNYNWFYYKNFPHTQQIDFILNRNMPNEDKLIHIYSLDISKEDKIDLIKQILHNEA